MPEPVEGRLQKHDLPPRDRKKIQDAVNTYYNLHVEFNQDKDLTKEERWRQFAKILKAALDRNLGEHWHVAVGNALGYACKVRQRAMGVWKFGSRDGCVVIIWKSPGLEPLDQNGTEAEKVKPEVSKLKEVRVVFPPAVHPRALKYPRNFGLCPYGGFHKWGIPNSWMVHGKSIDG